MTVTRSRVAAVVVVLVGLAACGSDSKTKNLSTGDVTDLPSGNADGTAFTGTYVIADSSIDGCDCRQGPCSGWHASSGHQILVKQDNGALSMDEKDSFGAEPCRGGIDKNGKFWCGYSYRANDLSLLGLWEGTGVATKSFDVTSNLTVAGTIDGQYYDCDVQGHFRAPYVGP